MEYSMGITTQKNSEMGQLGNQTANKHFQWRECLKDWAHKRKKGKLSRRWMVWCNSIPLLSLPLTFRISLLCLLSHSISISYSSSQVYTLRELILLFILNKAENVHFIYCAITHATFKSWKNVESTRDKKQKPLNNWPMRLRVLY